MEKYTIIALLLIAICAIPILYLIFFVFRIFVYIIRDKFATEIEKNDPIFGLVKKKGNYEWEGFVEYFLDSKEKIFIAIEADDNGPTENQRNIFLEIKKKYHSLYPQILKDLTTYFDGAYSEEEVVKFLHPISLYFSAEKPKWSISFVLGIEAEGDMAYDVDFMGLEIDEISAGD